MRNEVQVPAATVFLDMVRQRKIVHNGDVMLRSHVLNMRRKETERGWRFVKPDDPNLKIDAGVCAVGAVYLASTEEQSSFNDHGLFI